VKVPASLTESGFVPPLLKMKENAASPLANEEDPNGFVKVRTLLAMTQDDGLRLTRLWEERVQEPSVITMDEGKVIYILELVGILCVGFRVSLYVVYSLITVEVGVNTNPVTVPVPRIEEGTVIPVVI